MAEIIKFPRQNSNQDTECDEVRQFDADAAEILQRIFDTPKHEPLLSDEEYRELVRQAEKEAEEDEQGEGMGVLFWICLLIILL